MMKALKKTDESLEIKNNFEGKSHAEPADNDKKHPIIISNVSF